MTKKSKPSPEKTTDDRVLALLRETDDWRSGEELASILGVSRAAVAKRVAGLRAAGHVVEARTHTGYRLLARAETADYDAVAPWLTTRRFGRTGWRALPETKSTNTDAIAWALDGGPEGAVVTARHQLRGKGRRGHEWFSSPRGLAFSLILRPDRHRDDEATAWALAAMAGAIRAVTGLKAEAKVPNDLLVDGKKVCGVLTESGRRGDEPDWLVVGMGVNVNARAEDFPEAIRSRVTSLWIASDQPSSTSRLLAEFLNRFETAWRRRPK